MKEAQIRLKLKQMAEQGTLNGLPKIAMYTKVVYYAQKNKLPVGEYVEMVTGKKYAPPRARRSKLASVYPPATLWRRLETESVAELAKKAGCSRVALYNLIDRYREQGVWDEELYKK